MKQISKISLILSCLFLLVSCEKVIQIDLSGAKEAIVIEAAISSERMPFQVLVSKTMPFFGVGSDNPVSGAKVSIKVENGRPRYFTETEPGVYTLDKTWANPGYKYIVDVEYQGITYSASSYLNEPVPIVELGFSYFDGLGFLDNGYKVSCYLHDPVDQENYYRLRYYVNGVLSNENGEISLYSDKLFNGMNIGLGQRTLVFKETDTLTIELQSIDKATYDYYSTLENITATDWQGNAAPANPISNFSNGALGYFSAYSVSRKSVIVKDYIKK